MKNKQESWVPDEFYGRIMGSVPIVCVDLVIIRDTEFLLGKRKNEPEKGQWFVPGGRVMKGEKLLDAVIRKTKEEVGLDVNKEDAEFLMVGETIFEEGEDRHSVNVVYKISADDKTITFFDESQTSELGWFKKIDDKWHPFVKEVLKKAGFSQ